MNSIKKFFTFSEGVFSDAWEMSYGNLYALSKFQLLFSLVYLGILTWLVGFVLRILVGAVVAFLGVATSLNPLAEVDVMGFFRFQILLPLGLTLLFFLYTNHIEKTALALLALSGNTGERTGFVKFLIRSLALTPRVLWVKAIRGKWLLGVLGVAYVVSQWCGYADSCGSENLFSLVVMGLFLINIVFFLFFDGLTVWHACLYPKESLAKMQKRLPRSFRVNRGVTWIFWYGATVPTLLVLAMALATLLVWVAQGVGMLFGESVAQTVITTLLYPVIALGLLVWTVYRTMQMNVSAILYARARSSIGKECVMISKNTQKKPPIRRWARKFTLLFVSTGLFLFVIMQIVIPMFPVVTFFFSEVTKWEQYAEQLRSMGGYITPEIERILQGLGF